MSEGEVNSEGRFVVVKVLTKQDEDMNEVGEHWLIVTQVGEGMWVSASYVHDAELLKIVNLE